MLQGAPAAIDVLNQDRCLSLPAQLEENSLKMRQLYWQFLTPIRLEGKGFSDETVVFLAGERRQVGRTNRLSRNLSDVWSFAFANFFPGKNCHGCQRHGRPGDKTQSQTCVYEKSTCRLLSAGREYPARRGIRIWKATRHFRRIPGRSLEVTDFLDV